MLLEDINMTTQMLFKE